MRAEPWGPLALSAPFWRSHVWAGTEARPYIHAFHPFTPFAPPPIFTPFAHSHLLAIAPHRLAKNTYTSMVDAGPEPR